MPNKEIKYVDASWYGGFPKCGACGWRTEMRNGRDGTCMNCYKPIEGYPASLIIGKRGAVPDQIPDNVVIYGDQCDIDQVLSWCPNVKIKSDVGPSSSKTELDYTTIK